MPIVLIIALSIMCITIAKSNSRLRAISFIWGWTIAVSAIVGFAAFIFAKGIHAGNPPAFAGDFTGPTLTLTLLISSAVRLRQDKKVRLAKELDSGSSK